MRVVCGDKALSQGRHNWYIHGRILVRTQDNANQNLGYAIDYTNGVKCFCLILVLGTNSLCAWLRPRTCVVKLVDIFHDVISGKDYNVNVLAMAYRRKMYSVTPPFVYCAYHTGFPAREY